jgi:hypothetical protein
MACGAYRPYLSAFKASLAETKDHFRITALVHVCGPRSVTSFAADMITADLELGDSHVYIVFIIGMIFVTLQTGFSA